MVSEPEASQWSNATPTAKILLRRIRPERNERRFYAIEITTDLFGCLLLSRNWGRIGTAGRLRLDPQTDVEAARIALEEIVRAKIKRGYKPLTSWGTS